MADITIFTYGNVGQGFVGFNTGIIYDRSGTVGYQFQDEESSSWLTVKKTSDGGATFATSIAAGGSVAAYATVWADWWTPGDTGALIHIAAGNGPSVNYYQFDTSDDTWRDSGIGAGLSGPVGSQSGHVMGTMTLSITKAIGGGKVSICANARNDVENVQGSDMSSAVAPYSSFSSRASPYDSQTDGETTDAIMLLPGAEADTNDIVAIYRDMSADILYLRKYDDSADSWSSTQISTGIASSDSNTTITYAATIRESDNHVIVVAMTSAVTGETNNILTFDINTVTPTITAKGNVLTNAGDLMDVCIMVDNNSDDLYVGYIGGDASDTRPASVHVRYKISTDGGATWGSAVVFSDNRGPYRNINCDKAIPDAAGGRWQPVWGVHENTSINSFIETNSANSVEIAHATITLSGSITSSADEQDLRDGGKVLTITLSGDVWVAAGLTFDAERLGILQGLDSAQAEAAGWDAAVIPGMSVTNVVRTSSTVVTVSFPARSSYNITATETITATIPATALANTSSAVVATPTFTVATLSASAAISGTITSSATEQNIRDGGKTLLITVTGVTWLSAGVDFDAIRQDIIDGLDSAQSETRGWDAVVKTGLIPFNVVRTSDTVVTVLLPFFFTYSIGSNETITVTVPISAVNTTGSAIVASPTVAISTLSVDVTVSGTLLDEPEASVVAGSKTIILTLTGDTWVSSGANFNAQRQNIIDGLDSSSLAAAEPNGWNATARDVDLQVTDVARTSDTVVTITMPAISTYDIINDEVVKATVPATALTGAAELVGAPTILLLATAIVPILTCLGIPYIPRGGGASVILQFDLCLTQWKEVIRTNAKVLATPNLENLPLALNYAQLDIEIKGVVGARQHPVHPLVASTAHTPDALDLEEATLLWNAQAPTVLPTLDLQLVTGTRTYQGVITGLILVDNPGKSADDFIMTFSVAWNVSKPALREWN